MIYYKNIFKGRFVSRPNRFIANVEIDGEIHVCHVKNTGRCKELLTNDATVFLEKSDNLSRKTQFDLVAVQKGERLINMDSQVPNKVVEEWLRTRKPFGEEYDVYPEKTYGNSRFDFCLKSNKTDSIIFLEVKGCTLENDGVVMFPDAPTLRGLKHINELCTCVDNGISAAILILVQMENVSYFTPNYATDKAFGEALETAKKKGVKILCYDSIVTPQTIEIGKPVEIRL